MYSLLIVHTFIIVQLKHRDNSTYVHSINVYFMFLRMYYIVYLCVIILSFLHVVIVGQGTCFCITFRKETQT